MVPSLTPYDLPSPPKWGFHMPPRYADGDISATGNPIHIMFGSRVGFQGRRIEWRYLRLHQIQVGGNPPSWIISNGHISATAHSIHLYSARSASRGHPCDSTAFLFSLQLQYDEHCQLPMRPRPVTCSLLSIAACRKYVVFKRYASQF